MATLSRKAAKAMGIDVPDEPKRHKYGVAAKEDRTFGSLVFDSKAEMVRWQEHLVLIKTGHVTHVNRQVKVMLGDIPYVVDYQVLESLEKWWMEEVKGVETPRFKLVKKLWPKYGPCPLVILKRKGNGWVKTIIHPEQKEADHVGADEHKDPVAKIPFRDEWPEMIRKARLAELSALQVWLAAWPASCSRGLLDYIAAREAELGGVE